ncbi:hypothetical protein N7539_000997 [Penicillium diatomitis]|uniref:Uncharacterized protein n=1 Tax=Penicillium diatomitis TaxID=2819901 RepID=A0A9X0C2V9_9EURO|nr:uncharacterized protein N7539_000997 [Penicillium diatomitis]KAJ5495881.1 hypothetical protein N7539_000997 [Penicillium diatomitis]
MRGHSSIVQTCTLWSRRNLYRLDAPNFLFSSNIQSRTLAVPLQSPQLLPFRTFFRSRTGPVLLIFLDLKVPITLPASAYPDRSRGQPRFPALATFSADQRTMHDRPADRCFHEDRL